MILWSSHPRNVATATQSVAPSTRARPGAPIALPSPPLASERYQQSSKKTFAPQSAISVAAPASATPLGRVDASDRGASDSGIRDMSPDATMGLRGAHGAALEKGAACGMCVQHRCAKAVDSNCAAQHHYREPTGRERDLCQCQCCSIQCGHGTHFVRGVGMVDWCAKFRNTPILRTIRHSPPPHSPSPPPPSLAPSPRPLHPPLPPHDPPLPPFLHLCGCYAFNNAAQMCRTHCTSQSHCSNDFCFQSRCISGQCVEDFSSLE